MLIRVTQAKLLCDTLSVLSESLTLNNIIEEYSLEIFQIPQNILFYSVSIEDMW